MASTVHPSSLSSPVENPRRLELMSAQTLQRAECALGAAQFFFLSMIYASHSHSHAQILFVLVCATAFCAAYCFIYRISLGIRAQAEDLLSALGMAAVVTVAPLVLLHRLVFHVKSHLLWAVLEFSVALAAYVLCIAAPIQRERRAFAAAAPARR